jgi:metalloendopeptidase OMA1, mitochondrial
VLFESKEANAFCLPGGKVGVFSGILPLAKNEAGLATIIGHEIAHAVARHGAERISQSILFQSGGELLAAGLGQSEMSPQVRELVGAVYGIGVQVGGELPHGRRQELEADRIGMIYMARAGYDPREAIAFWERFQEFNQRTSGQVPALLRTHPVDSVRMEQLRRYLPEALEEYRRARP